MQAADAFRQELEAAGLRPPEVFADGKLHRCPVEGKPGAKDGAYILHGDGLPAGWYQNHRTGEEGTWSAAVDRALSPDECRALAAHMEATRRQREAEQARAYAEAAKRAQHLLDQGQPCGGHSYLDRKGVAPCPGLKVDSEGRLLVPVLGVEGKAQSLQSITPGGDKRFLAGGKIAAGYFAIKGGAGPLVVCEGLATGLSLHEATGHTVLCAFAAGNLEAVARMARERYPERAIILAGDEDHATEGNPGLTKARAAALAVGGKLALPVFQGDRTGRSDFNDLAASDGLEEVRAQVDTAQVVAQEPGPSGLTAITLEQFLTLELPERGHLLAPVVPEQGLVMLYAPRGQGKTFAALSIAYAVAAGGPALRWQAPQRRPVLYLDGEMPASVMQERLARIVAGAEAEAPPGYFRLVTPDLTPDGIMPNLATLEGQTMLEPLLGGVSLIVVDNLACLARAGRENEAEGWLPVQGWLLAQRRAGRSVLLVHHAGKGGDQRGTSSREDVLDTVIRLSRPKDYNPAEGARFIVELTKARGITGPEADPFEATLVELPTGGLAWTTKAVANLRLEQVRELKALGLSVREIAEELGISKSSAARLAKQLEA